MPGHMCPHRKRVSIPIGHLTAPTNTWFLGFTEVHIPTGTSIGSAVFAGLTVVTNMHRHTNRQTTLDR